MSRARRATVVALGVTAALAGGAALAATPFSSHVASLTTITISGDVVVAGTGGRTGLVRARYVLPRSWRSTGGLGRATLRFATRTSCGHRVTLTARLVEAPARPAAERAVALTTATTGVVVRTAGTRDGAAFRVVSPRGAASTVRGVLVQPLATSWVPPSAAGRRVYAELAATATADPRRECHAGGPRGIAAALGDSFAAGHAGGFLHP